jgi:hypothetical protein
VAASEARLGRHQPALVGEHHGLDAVAQAELHQDASDMASDRRFLDDELYGDLAVREPTRDLQQYLALAQGSLV